MSDLIDKLDIGVLITRAVAYIPDLIASIAILVLFWLLYRLTRVPLRAVLERAGVHRTVIEMLVDSIYRLTVFIFGLVMAADQIGINVGAALAGIGGRLGLAITFVSWLKTNCQAIKTSCLCTFGQRILLTMKTHNISVV